MEYLVTTIAAFLLFAMLLGLLLGWLIWGYAARQRASELRGLREHMEGLPMAIPRMTLAGYAHASLDAPGESLERAGLDAGDAMPQRPVPHPLVEDDLSMAAPASEPSFEFGAENPVPYSLPRGFQASRTVPDRDDLEAAVKETRLQHFEQQVRELEGIRDRLPLLQADLSDAIAGRRSAESRLEEAKNDFEVRLSNFLGQIRNFERAAAEWDRARDEYDRSELAKDKELATVKAHLRDLQNSQLPQKAEAPGMSALEIADLRERYQKALQERDALAAEWKARKQNDGNRHSDGERIAELEEVVRTRDANLAEQAAQIETLLWRVAELEPFASSVPQLEENLRRLESEIAGHVAMHSESSDHIRSLLNRIAELEPESAKVPALQSTVQEHEAEITRLAENHAEAREEQAEAVAALESQVADLKADSARAIELQQTLQDRDAEIERLAQEHEILQAGWQQAISEKDVKIANHLSALNEQASRVSSLQAQVADLEGKAQRLIELEQVVRDRDGEIRGLLAAHSDMYHEMQGWKQSATELEPLAWKTPELEKALKEREVEIQRLKEVTNDKDGQLTFIQERLAALSERLEASQQRLQQVEPLAAQLPELEQKLTLQEDRHQSELTRLKVNSAQRTRRLRQGITNFKV